MTCKVVATKASPRRATVLAEYRARNKDACALRVVVSVAKKPEQYKAKAREIAARRLAKTPERVHAIRKAGYERNRAVEIARVRRRQGRIRDAAPWITVAHRAEMQGLYQFCRIFPAFEVDHIIPLNGKQVSGLHVPLNLQAIPVCANRQKGATFEVQ
jgi:5-methylcytosine-specific restriction endonuclease McrA